MLAFLRVVVLYIGLGAFLTWGMFALGWADALEMPGFEVVRHGVTEVEEAAALREAAMAGKVSRQHEPGERSAEPGVVAVAPSQRTAPAAPPAAPPMALREAARPPPDVVPQVAVSKVVVPQVVVPAPVVPKAEAPKPAVPQAIPEVRVDRATPLPALSGAVAQATTREVPPRVVSEAAPVVRPPASTQTRPVSKSDTSADTGLVTSPAARPDTAPATRPVTSPARSSAAPAVRAPAAGPSAADKALPRGRWLAMRRVAGFGVDDLASVLDDGGRSADDIACVMLRKVRFRAGSRSLLASSRAELELVAQVLATVKSGRIEIGSKLGPGRPMASDTALRIDRAAIVRDVLITLGAPAGVMVLDDQEGFERAAADVSRAEGSRAQSMGICVQD
jgi:hypothetical protein